MSVRDGRDGRDGKDGLDGVAGKDGRSIQGPKGDPGPKGDKGDKGDPGRAGMDAPRHDAQSYLFTFAKGDDGLTHAVLAEGSDGRAYAFDIIRDADETIHEITATPV